MSATRGRPRHEPFSRSDRRRRLPCGLRRPTADRTRGAKLTAEEAAEAAECSYSAWLMWESGSPSPQAGLAPGYRPGGQSPPRGPSAWLSHALGERSLIFLSPVVFSPCRRSTAGNSASWSSCRGHRPGNVPPVVLTIDAGKRAESGQAGHRPGNVPRGFRGADVPPVVPTIDAGQFQGQADGGQAGHRPGKRRGLPADGPFARAGAFRVT